jgi:hypothetical protein
MTTLCQQVRVYTVEDVARGGRPGLHYQRALATAGTKALCVAWTHKAECVVSGAADGTAHVWEAATGRHLLRITAGGGGLRAPGTELCVWAVLVRFSLWLLLLSALERTYLHRTNSLCGCLRVNAAVRCELSL